jgi:hypothetical protein
VVYDKASPNLRNSIIKEYALSKYFPCLNERTVVIMEVSDATSITAAGSNKYVRVLPVIGLLLYYIGHLIVSLDVANAEIYLLQIVLFSIVLIIGLIIMKKEILLFGEIIAILGSVGAIVLFFESLFEGGLAAFGSGIVFVSAAFLLLSIYALLKK